MNKTQQELAAKVARLTQHLQLAVTDSSRSELENKRASIRFAEVSTTLERIVPRAHLSADERVERLAKAVEGATPDPRFMQPDTVKLERLTRRIHELLPDPDLSLDEKLSRLGRQFAARFPDVTDKAS